MATLSILHTVDAVSSMQALQDVLSEELFHIEACIQKLASALPEVEGSSRERDAYLKARAALHGGMASIIDVLGWVRLTAEKDTHGNEHSAVRSLPNVPVSSIN